MVEVAFAWTSYRLQYKSVAPLMRVFPCTVDRSINNQIEQQRTNHIFNFSFCSYTTLCFVVSSTTATILIMYVIVKAWTGVLRGWGQEAHIQHEAKPSVVWCHTECSITRTARALQAITYCFSSVKHKTSCMAI